MERELYGHYSLMTESTPQHGSSEYYLAVAGIIPLLLLAYFLQTDTYGAYKRLSHLFTGKFSRPFNRILFRFVGPVLALTGAFMAGITSLLALFDKRPTGWNSMLSVLGLSMILSAGLLHLILVLRYEIYRWGHDAPTPVEELQVSAAALLEETHAIRGSVEDAARNGIPRRYPWSSSRSR